MCAINENWARMTEVEAIAIHKLPNCPECGESFLHETDDVVQAWRSTLIEEFPILHGDGPNLGHIDAVCLKCNVGVSCKTDRAYKGETSITTAPASHVAFLQAQAYFGLNKLYLFVASVSHSVMIRYDRGLHHVRVRAPRPGRKASRCNLVFTVK